MTELNSPMTKNMPDWNALFNQYAQKMDNAQNTLDQLEWTPSTDGLTLLNGFAFSDWGPNYYETAQFGGKKLIHLTLHLKLTTAIHASHSGDAIQVPEAIGFNYPISGTANDMSTWGVSGATRIGFAAMGNGDIDFPTGDSLYTIDAFYLN